MLTSVLIITVQAFLVCGTAYGCFVIVTDFCDINLFKPKDFLWYMYHIFLTIVFAGLFLASYPAIKFVLDFLSK